MEMSSQVEILPKINPFSSHLFKRVVDLGPAPAIAGDIYQVLQDFLDDGSSLGSNYLIIAGGFPRDIIADKPFKDIDVYYVGSEFAKLVMLIANSGRFDFIKDKCNESFLTTIFCEEDFERQGRPICRVQFMGWHTQPENVLNRFDLEHCKFFIPIFSQKHTPPPTSNICHQRIYSFESAIKALHDREIKFSEQTVKELHHLERTTEFGSTDYIHNIEKLLRRVKRFMHRGMILNEQDKALLLSAFEGSLSSFRLVNFLKSKANFKSLFLENPVSDYSAEYSGSSFTCKEILENLLREWLALFPTDGHVLLLSKSQIIRDVVFEILQDENKKGPKPLFIQAATDENSSKSTPTINLIDLDW